MIKILIMKIRSSRKENLLERFMKTLIREIKPHNSTPNEQEKKNVCLERKPIFKELE